MRDDEPTLLDRAIAAVSPSWGFRRQQFRRAMAEARIGYDGARSDRLYGDWIGGDGSADAILLTQLPKLRQRCRELARNNPIAASILHGKQRNVVGCGLRPQSLIDPKIAGVSIEQARELRRVAERIFARWMRGASLDHRQSFYSLQRLVQRRRDEDGEAFWHLAMMRRQGQPYETVVEVVESDRVDTPAGKEDNGRIRSGVELGASGEPVAYWVLEEHPGDGHLARSGGRRSWRKVPVRDGNGSVRFGHLARIRRPNQTRGEPLLAPAMTTLRDLGSTLEAERVAKRIESCFAGWILRDPQAWGAQGRNPATGRIEMPLQPAVFQQLAPGESVVMNEPKRGGETFNSHIQLLVKMTGAAVELPLELVLLDFTQSNFSNTRAAKLEAQRGFEIEQADLVHCFCQPCYEAVLEEAWLKGEFLVHDFYALRDVWTACEWMPDGWRWVDPKSESAATETSLRTGLSNLAIEAHRQGRDWEDHLRQNLEVEQRWHEMRKEMHLDPAPLPGSGQVQQQVPVGAGVAPEVPEQQEDQP